MTLIDLVVIILALFLATLLYFHIKQGKLMPSSWPRLFGIGAGTFMFIRSMIGSMSREPLSEIVDDAVNNFIWSLAFGIVVYLGSRTIARRMRDKK